MRRRFAWVLLAVGLALGWGAAYRWLRPGGASGGEAGRFVFLFAWESNNLALRGLPREIDRAPAADFDEDGQSLRVPTAADVPAPGTLAVVLQRVDSLDTNLASRVYPVTGVPARVPVSAPVTRPGRLADAGGLMRYVDNVVDNRSRLLTDDLVITKVEEDGTVEFRLGAEKVRLAPGQGWGVGYVRGVNGIQTVRDGPDWEQRIAGRLGEGKPVTVFSVFNHGRWPLARVVVAGSP